MLDQITFSSSVLSKTLYFLIKTISSFMPSIFQAVKKDIFEREREIEVLNLETYSIMQN